MNKSLIPNDERIYNRPDKDGKHPSIKGFFNSVIKLQDGKKYWLGTTFGIYDIKSDTFNLGNCSIDRCETTFKDEEA